MKRPGGLPTAASELSLPPSQVRQQALLFIKRMYEKDQLREYVEKFALNYLQLLVHPNPPSVLFGADKDTGNFRAAGWVEGLKITLGTIPHIDRNRPT